MMPVPAARKRSGVFMLLLALPLLVAGCAARGFAAPELAARPVRAIATTGMIADIVRNVGGDRVAVIAMMGPGVDPHLYKASEGDILRLAQADLIFYNGLHLEARLAEVLERLGGKVTTVAVSDGIDRGSLLQPEAFEGQYDPHIWFDVALWEQAVVQVREALVAADPAGAEGYRAHAAAYLEQLAGLDAYVRQQAARVPPDQRVLVTAHDAFNYFGRAYGFDVRGLQGISTAAEAGTGDVQALAAFLAERRIKAIFVESSVPVRNVEAVQAAVRARGHDVQIGGELFSDAMGTAGTPEGTYIGMVRHNIDTIVNGLLGDESSNG